MRKGLFYTVFLASKRKKWPLIGHSSYLTLTALAWDTHGGFVCLYGRRRRGGANPLGTARKGAGLQQEC
jgi:hypothetical protein